MPADQTKATVPGLTHGEEYEFRVIAVNKGGNSDPSDPTFPVVAKPRNCRLLWNRKSSLHNCYSSPKD